MCYDAKITYFYEIVENERAVYNDTKEKTVITYGVTVYNNENKGKILFQKSDIFEDQEKAILFVGVCNQYKVSILHFYDILSDIFDKDDIISDDQMLIH